MNQMLGSGSLCFSKTPFIISTASIVGKKEGEGPLKEYFDVVGRDEKFGGIIGRRQKVLYKRVH